MLKCAPSPSSLIVLFPLMACMLLKEGGGKREDGAKMGGLGRSVLIYIWVTLPSLKYSILNVSKLGYTCTPEIQKLEFC